MARVTKVVSKQRASETAPEAFKQRVAEAGGLLGELKDWLAADAAKGATWGTVSAWDRVCGLLREATDCLRTSAD